MFSQPRPRSGEAADTIEIGDTVPSCAIVVCAVKLAAATAVTSTVSRAAPTSIVRRDPTAMLDIAAGWKVAGPGIVLSFAEVATARAGLRSRYAISFAV